MSLSAALLTFVLASSQRASADPVHAEILHRVAPAVVHLVAEASYTKLANDLEQVFGDGVRIEVAWADEGGAYRNDGTGIVFDDVGHVVTTASFATTGERFRALLADGKEVEATLVGFDLISDLAVLRLNGAAPTPVVLEDDVDGVRAGMNVCVVTADRSAHCTISEGVVRDLKLTPGANRHHDYLFLGIPPAPNLTGAPVVNGYGRLVGIISARLPCAGTLAIPAMTVRRIVDALVTTGTVRRGWLGVTVAWSAERVARGVRVQGIVTGSPAKEAGLQPGDHILEVDGQAIETPPDLHHVISDGEPDTMVDIVIERDGEPRMLRATLGEHRSRAGAGQLAVRVHQTYLGVTTRTARRTHGLVVTHVRLGSPAAKAGVLPGDRILALDGTELAQPTELRKMVRSSPPGRLVSLRIVRNLEPLRLTASLGSLTKEVLLPGPQVELGPEDLRRLADFPPAPPSRRRPFADEQLRRIRQDVERVYGRSLAPR